MGDPIIINGFVDDPPGPGEAKLLIRSKGTRNTTDVLVVTPTGEELTLRGAWVPAIELDDDIITARLTVAGVGLDVEAGAVEVEEKP